MIEKSLLCHSIQSDTSAFLEHSFGYKAVLNAVRDWTEILAAMSDALRCQIWVGIDRDLDAFLNT